MSISSCYARVRRLPIWIPATHPWTLPIQDANQALSCHHPHTISKSSFSSPYISPHILFIYNRHEPELARLDKTNLEQHNLLIIVSFVLMSPEVLNFMVPVKILNVPAHTGRTSRRVSFKRWFSCHAWLDEVSQHFCDLVKERLVSVLYIYI